MSFSGGVYTLPGPALNTGEIVSASENNTFRNDVATAFNLTFLRNGTSTATANLPMGGYKLTGLGVATTIGDALSYGQAATVSTLTATGAAALNGGITVDSTAFTVADTTGNTSIAGTLAVTGVTTLTANPVLSGGTANGVAYLNGSKVLTTGSALTFDGTNLTLGTATPWTASGYGLFTLNGSSGSGYTLEASGTRIFTAYANGTSAVLGSTANVPVSFTINDAEQMRLTSTGLGIGTSSVIQPLTLGGTGNIYAPSGATWYTGGDLYIRAGTGGFLSFGANNTNDLMRLDSSGNLGLGVTPSAWTDFRVLNVGSNAFFGGAIAGSGTVAAVGANARYNNGWIYQTTAPATYYDQNNNAAPGAHRWFTAPSGTAGNAISFTQAMTLDASGNLLVGNTSQSVLGERLLVNGAGVVIQSASATNRGMLGNFGGSDFIVGSYDSIALAFRTGNTERMRIDSSGNVMVGGSAISSYGKFAVQYTTPSGTGNASTPIYGSYDGVSKAYQLSATGASYSYAGVSGSELWMYSSGFNAMTFGSDGATPIKFVSSGSERMRIDSDGNLLVGATTYNGSSNTPGFGVNPIGQFAVERSGGICGVFNRYTSDGSIVIFRRSGTQVGSIDVTTTATAYVTSSDYRLKENIQPMQNALDVVAQLNPVTYTWKADGSDGQGFIAHELQAVVPDCVTGDKDAVDAEGKPVYQGIDTSFLVATLTKAIQEQQEQINQLKAEVAALKGN